MKRVRWTIKRKLLTLGTGAFLLAVVLIAFGVWSQIREQSRNELDRVSEEVATRIGSTLDLVRSVLLTVAQVQGVQELNREETEQLILDILHTIPFLEGIGVFKADGQFLSARSRPDDEARKPDPPQTVADRLWFQQLIWSGEPVVSGLLRGRVSGQNVILVAVPIRKGTDRPHAGLAASLNLSRWFTFSSGLSLPQDLRLTVVDIDGVVLAHNRDPRLVGQRLPADLRRPGLVEREDRRHLLESALVRGVGWRVLAMLPRAALYARAWQEVRVIVFPMLAILGLAAIGGLLIARGVWRPLQALTSRIREFGEGRPAPIQVSSTDEVGELARAFNEMSERIHQSKAALEQRAKRLAALNALAGTVSGSLKLDEVLSKGLDSAIQVMGMDGGLSRLLDEASGELVVAAGRGAVADHPDAPRRVKLGEGFSGHVAITKQPLFVRDTTRDSRTAVFAELFGPGSAASVPLLAHDRVVGTMSLYSREPHAFDKEDTETLTAIGQQVGLAVETARLYGETQARLKDAEILLEIAQAFSGTLNLKESLKIITQRTAQIVGVDRCSVFLWESERFVPVMSQFASGVPAPELWKAFKQAGSMRGDELPALLQAIETKAPVVIPDPFRNPLVPEWWTRLAALKSIAAIPLLRPDKVVGVLLLDNTTEDRLIDERQVTLATTIASQVALAIDNASLSEAWATSYRAAQARSRELAALADAGTTMVSTLDLPAVLETIAESASTLLGAKLCVVFELDSDGQYLLPRATRGMPLGAAPRLKLGQGAAGNAALSRRPVFSPDIREQPMPTYDELVEGAELTVREFAERIGFRAILAVPLVSKRALLGVLAIYWAEVHPYDEREVRLLTALAQQAAIAIDNAGLYEAIRQQASRLQALYEVGNAVGSTLELPQVLQQIADQAAQVIGADRCAVWELNQTDQRLYVRATKGVFPGEFPSAKVGQGAVGMAVVTKEPCFSPDLSTHPPPGYDEIVEEYGVSLMELARRWDVRSLLAVPLISREQAVGVINIFWDEPHPFKQEEVETLTAFASQAALAMTNARLYEESIRDQTVLEHSRQTLEAIHQLSVTMQESVSMRGRLDQILRGAREVLGVERIGIWLPDADGSHLGVLAGLDPIEPVGAIRIPLTHEGGALAQAFGEGREIWAAPDQALPPALRLAPQYLEIPFLRTKSFGLLPLTARGKVIGVMAVDNKVTSRPIPRESIPLFRIFAQQAAVAIENARLVENLQTTLEELKVAQEQLVRGETLRSLGEMAAGTAHHLNNLLAVVVARVQLLLRTAQDPKLRRSLQIVERAALDGAGVVRRIQQFARVRAREETTPVNLNRVAEEVLEFTRPRWQNEAQARGIKIEACLSPGQIPPVSGQAAELREAVTNLVLNAVDALPQGGRIVLSSWVENGSVLLAVADNGVGMAKEATRHAFEPFFTTKGVKSTGLGLSVAYGIVQRHGGTITLESEEGQGTTITLRFPAMEPAPRESAPPVEPRVRAARLLIIDDEPAVLEAVAEVLKSLGHAVATAGSGPEGLGLLERERYDLVLTDLGMPEMTGWQVVEAVKSRWPWIPVVLLTGWGDQLEPADIARVDRLLQKPFQLEDIQAALASLIPPK